MPNNTARQLTDVDWRFASRNVDDDFHTDIVFLRSSVRKMREFTGVSHDQALLFYEGFSGEFYYPNERSKYVCQQLINRMTNDLGWGNGINNQINIRSAVLEGVWTSSTYYVDFSEMSNGQLKELYASQLEAQISLYQTAWIPEVLQTENYGLTDYLIEKLSEKINNKTEIGPIFQILTTSDLSSVYLDSEQEIMELVLLIKSSDKLAGLFELPLKYLRLCLPSSINQRLDALVKKYSYLAYHGFGERKAYDFDYYLFKVIELVKNENNTDTANVALNSKSIAASEKEKIIKRLGIEEKLAKVFQIYSDFAVTKARRRLAQLKNFYFLDKLIFELSIRLNVPEAIIRFMMPEEIINALENKISNLDSIERRTKEMVYYVNQTEEKIFLDSENINFIGELRKKTKPEFNNKLYGVTACGGHVVGRAITILREAEYNYNNIILDENIILVSIEADPDLLPIMKKSKAIITDQGGITCHAAVIAKEFNIPCITGTKYATQFIQDGDLLDVDANRGIVTILEKNRN